MLEVRLSNADTYDNDYDRAQATIQKWERILQILNENKLPTNIGMASCAYCKEYNKPRAMCDGCPIKKETGEPFCYKTPFDDFVDVYERQYEYKYSTNAFLSDLRFWAKRELVFLKNIAKNIPKPSVLEHVFFEVKQKFRYMSADAFRYDSDFGYVSINFLHDLYKDEMEKLLDLAEKYDVVLRVEVRDGEIYALIEEKLK